MATHKHRHRRSAKQREDKKNADKKNNLNTRDAAPEPAPEAAPDPLRVTTVVDVVYVTPVPGPRSGGGRVTAAEPVRQSRPEETTKEDEVKQEESRPTPTPQPTTQESTEEAPRTTEESRPNTVSSEKEEEEPETSPTTSSSTESSSSKFSTTSSSTSTSSSSSSAASLTSSSSATSRSPPPVSSSSNSIAQTTRPTSVSASSAGAAQQLSSVPSASASDSGGLTGGGRAGVALGVILGLGLIIGLVLLYLRRKRRPEEQYIQTADEKTHHSPVASDPPDVSMAPVVSRTSSVRTTRTASAAPRLSLRPLTQFEPNLGADGRGAGNQSPNASLAELSARGTGPGMAGYLQPAGGHPGQANPPQNSFGPNTGASSDLANRDASRDTVWPAPPSNTASDMKPAGLMNGPTPSSSGIGAAVVAAAQVKTHSRASSPTTGHTPNSDGSAPPAPFVLNGSGAGADSDSIRSAAASSVSTSGGGKGSSGGSTPNAVYRVQLDFKPSMEDELELHTGQLVRLLHEYDDGWALCVRLDRSQQGVAPRTCLSSRPVKPRPAGPPPPNPGQMRGPQPSGGSPIAGSPRSMTPTGNKPPGPYVALQPRPLSPGGRAPQSPYAGQPRSSSPANGRSSPAQYTTVPRTQSPAGRRNGPAPYATQPRPSSPAGSRNAPGPHAMSPRPMSPAGQRSRSNSTAQLSPSDEGTPQRLPTVLRPGSPALGQVSPPPMRKPVPGQAL